MIRNALVSWTVKRETDHYSRGSSTRHIPGPAMDSLQREIHRLYLVPASAGQGAGSGPASLIDDQGRVRAMVLELARPADWAALSRVWQGVQADLGLPAPAIAVSGKDGYQLWFSLADPLPAAQATAFLEALCGHYLADTPVERLRLMPAAAASAGQPAVHAQGPQGLQDLPAVQVAPGYWSAFVAPDLAPVFADEPWLDLPPGVPGQAELLSRLESMPLADFQRALARLRPGRATIDAPAPGSTTTTTGAWLEPKRFLLDVMNNDSVDLALRIEAAKALLPYFDDHGPGTGR